MSGLVGTCFDLFIYLLCIVINKKNVKLHFHVYIIILTTKNTGFLMVFNQISTLKIVHDNYLMILKINTCVVELNIFTYRKLVQLQWNV